MRLYFIRHGQSANNLLWDETGSDLGRSDDPLLTPKGFEQACSAASWLTHQSDPWDGKKKGAGYGITHIYSSPMRRAVATGAEIAQSLCLPLVLWKDWHECGGIYLYDSGKGQFQIRSGITTEELRAQYPGLIHGDSGFENGWWNRPMENEKDCSKRARKVLKELLEKHGSTDDRVAIVSHGGFYVRFVAALIRKEQLKPGWFSMNNTGISRFDLWEHDWNVIYQNSVFHLPPELIS